LPVLRRIQLPLLLFHLRLRHRRCLQNWSWPLHSQDLYFTF
jgi:hypothetical protein